MDHLVARLAAIGHPRRRAVAGAAGAAPAAPAPDPAPPADAAIAVLVREGEVWSVGWGGQETRLKHSRGLEILAQLVSNPGRPFHV